MKEKLPEVDIQQLERNLELSHEERILRHQKALDLVLELKNVKVIRHEKPERSIDRRWISTEDFSIFKKLLKNKKKIFSLEELLTLKKQKN